MPIRKLLLTFTLIGLPAVVQAAPNDPCDLDRLKSSRELHEVLSDRSVEIVALAGKTDRPSKERLARLITSTAPFSLGAGDVGRPLGSGLEGASALATLMDADGYGFAGWDYMDAPTDSCGPQTVTVTFTNRAEARRSEIEFSYENGRLVAATGWERSYKSGSLGQPPGQK
jgi:hypothetical protein